MWKNFINKFLYLFILTDLVFILLHIIHVYTPLIPSSLYSLAMDRGYAEFFQYTKELWILAIFFYLGIKHRKLIFVVYSVLFLYFLIDDSFELHERFGALLAEMLNFRPVFGLRAVDLGELTVTAAFGALFFIAIAITHIGSDKYTKLISRTIIILVIFLTFFGVGMDMIEIMVENPILNPILVIVEEGGEMLIMSFITCYVIGLVDRNYN